MGVPSKVDEELVGFERLVSQDRINAYADASGDHNPIHLDEEFAATTRFGQRIAHGMLSLAFVWEMIAANYPQTWHEGSSVKTRFTSPVVPGEVVAVRGKVSKRMSVGNREYVECEIGVSRPDGENALTGTMRVPLP